MCEKSSLLARLESHLLGQFRRSFGLRNEDQLGDPRLMTSACRGSAQPEDPCLLARPLTPQLARSASYERVSARWVG